MRRVFRLLLAVAMLAGLMSFAPAPAEAFCDIDLTTAPNCYVAVDDGTVIAMSVRVPADCRTGVRDCPTIFEMAGYENGSAEGLTTIGEFFGDGAPLARDSRQLTEMFDGPYATVHASVRGTGCSGGEFDLFSLRSARDGAWLIDNWVAKQDWSNGDVGIMGHSYSGITGFMVASQRPAALRAATVSGLIDDLYRGIQYPGGVVNGGFPPLWTLGVRQAYDFLGGLSQGLGRPIWRNLEPLNPNGQTFDTAGQSGQCATNLSTRGRTVANDPIVQGGLGDTDNSWWQARALATFAHRIEVPIHIQGAYQDEQTGPRGTTRLWELVQGVPKRLIITNGSHGTAQSNYVMNNRRKWMDHWMRGVDGGYGTLAEDKTTVDVLQEFRGGGPGSVITDASFPLATTQWTDFHLRGGGALTQQSPQAGDVASTDYLSGSGRQSWFWETGPEFGAPLTTADGPDEATFVSAAFTEPVSIAGPVTANIWLSSSTPDTEIFVQLIDVGTDGQTRLYVQRGLLKASHRAIDTDRSDCVNASNVKVACATAGSHMYRPHRPHTNPMLLTPGEPVEYLIEIFPIGHVFRPGHKMMVKVMAPPRADSYYVYVPRTLPGVNTILHDQAHPSRITLPVIPGAPVGADPGQCSRDNVRCIKLPNG